MKNTAKRWVAVLFLIAAALLAVPSVVLTLVIAPAGIFVVILTLFLLLFGIKFLNESRRMK